MFTLARRGWEDFFDRSMRKELYAFPGVSRIAIRRPREKNRSNTESYAGYAHCGNRVGRAKIPEISKRFPNLSALLLRRSFALSLPVFTDGFFRPPQPQARAAATAELLPGSLRRHA